MLQANRKEDKSEADMSRLRDEDSEKEEDKKEMEALRQQNQLLVNKFQQLHGASEADI